MLHKAYNTRFKKKMKKKSGMEIDPCHLMKQLSLIVRFESITSTNHATLPKHSRIIIIRYKLFA
jgi:hypothetical protein